MSRLATFLDRVRTSELPVSIQGETGTGKGLIARLIHHERARASGPFLVLDCAAIPDGLVEVELSGARSGAYTDLTRDRQEVLTMADGGTVLVDELPNLSLAVQAKLLRALSRGSIRSVGDESERRIDVRFIFTTARDIDVEVKRGRLREDLVHRSRVLSVRVPSLRERLGDMPDLVRLFLREDHGTSGVTPVLGPGMLERLLEMVWPGNVRNFRNVVTRLCVENAQRITVESLDRVRAGEPAVLRTVVPDNVLAHESLSALKDRVEREYIVYHFRRLNGDTRTLSEFLRIGRQHLYKRCRQLGIRLWDERKRM